MQAQLKNPYLLLILAHCLLGFIVYVYKPFAMLYFLAALAYFVYQIFTNGNRNNEALYAAAYVAGGEVFFRMTGATIAYEAGKYSVIVFVLLGLFFSGTSRKSGPYWLYLLLLIPGIVYASFTLGYSVDFKKAIFFNLAGPFCLGITALYCVDRKVTYKQMHRIYLHLLLPVVAMAIYLFFYTPDTREILKGTGSNFAASGGFGPNQVATALGIGMFVLVVRLFSASKNRIEQLVNLLLLSLISYRAIVTFSRGGVITAIIISIAFLYFYFRRVNTKAKGRITISLVLIFLVAIATWGLSLSRTDGLIGKRYANQDAAGRVKEDVSTGRGVLIETELQAFFDNPMLGVGVGKSKAYRQEVTGINIASHNEISRTLSEHGIPGILALLILIIYPLSYRITNRSNILFFSALGFWFLTINHSAMRIAAPAFIYALCLLNVVYEKKKTPVRRKRLVA